MSLTAVELARRTWRELGDDFAVDLAASISYYAILSLFPLAIGLVSLFSLILEADAAETEVFGFFHTHLPGSESILAANVESVENIRGLLGIFSAIGLLWSSSLLFGAITRTVNRAWDIPYDRPFYVEKPRHFIMAFSVAPLLVLSVVSTTGLQVLGNEEWPVLGRLAFFEHNGINTLARPLPFVFSLAIFLLIYKFAPYTRTYWRYIWPGALVAALLFDVGQKCVRVLPGKLRRLREDLRGAGLRHRAAGMDLYVRHDRHSRGRGVFGIPADAPRLPPRATAGEHSREAVALEDLPMLLENHQTWALTLTFPRQRLSLSESIRGQSDHFRLCVRPWRWISLPTATLG